MKIKYGNLTEDSKSDFDRTKKAEYVDAHENKVADKENKHKLKNPRPIKEFLN